MNKIILAALISAVAAAPAFANEATKASDVPSAATSTTTTTTTATGAKVVTNELKDGTKIEITGDKVEVVGKDGKKTAAPDGEHILKDGSKITTKSGLIVKK